MAGESRGQDLAAGRAELRAAEEPHHGRAVDGVVDRLAGLEVVERREPRVHRDVPHRRQLVEEELLRILGRDLAQPVGRDREADPVGLAVLDLRDRGLTGQVEALGDLVGIAGGLCVGRPDLEVLVAHEDDLVVRVVRLDHVRPRARDRLVALVLRGRGGRHDARERHRQLLQPLAVGLREVERHGALRVVRDDAALERAGRGGLEAGRGTHDRAVEARSRRAVHLEDALHRREHVGRLDDLAVGELDALAHLEHPRLAAVGRLGNRDREIGDDRVGRGALGLLEVDEAVLGGLLDLPALERVVDLRIHRPGSALIGELEGASIMAREMLRGRREAVAGTTAHAMLAVANAAARPNRWRFMLLLGRTVGRTPAGAHARATKPGGCRLATAR